ncbi:CPBP family intramembrane metalloprotease [Roseiconus nitratireducens]|uniref:CPBP family intramembrane metalloprotease n=1 Tax=Roseiconus nitratireducens TaxID=2605748 RepID=A0A5M6DEK9_9BACT|nr:CPBP family intramembrane glutamic endopeptidase [Roseiconus nitratireducens]KAA5545957.1 CPBP family intramembrane metalloprotease [Roseiconus nitratireducens]
MTHEALYTAGFALIAASVVAALLAGCVLWIRWFAGKSKRNLCGDVSQELITRQPQPTPRWTVFDFLLMFGLFILAASLLSGGRLPSGDLPAEPLPAGANQANSGQAVSQQALSSARPIADRSVERTEDATESLPDSQATSVTERSPATPSLRQQIRAHFYANLIAFGLTLAYLRVLNGATLSNLGLIPTLSDLRRGVIATLWILTPVLLVNIVVVQLIQYEHSVTNLLADDTRLGTFLFLLLSAGFVTPIVEEFQFRLLLQGGLQQFADPPPANDGTSNWMPRSFWPIVVTSLIFAGMHWGQGGAPIPLFFLSVGLGALYQGTGRLTPAIVVHLLLNTATLCMEFCRINANIQT